MRSRGRVSPYYAANNSATEIIENDFLVSRQESMKRHNEAVIRDAKRNQRRRRVVAFITFGRR